MNSTFKKKPNKYLAGTRPEIDRRRIIMTQSDGFDGYEIMEYVGMVWGMSVRAKDLGQDCLMLCKNITGGELNSYTKLSDESRQRAIDTMLEMASRKSANAIINVNFEISGSAQGATEVSVYGTAVKIEPIPNYVPTGALGNIFEEWKEKDK